MEKNRSIHGLSPCGQKMLKVMKLTVLLMLITFVGVFASETYSQTTKLSLTANKISLEEFLIKIEAQSEFRFFYTGNIDVEKKVTGEFKDRSITEILDEIKEEGGIKYEMMGRQIILSPIQSGKSINSIQQQKSLTGKVTDTNGDPLPGVTVIVKGTTTGTITDFDGNYSFNAKTGDVLVFSFVGMTSQEITVGSQTTINVKMATDAIGIEEVVAVGYGTQKKIDLTGAVSSVDSEQLQDLPTPSVNRALQGKAAGVFITSNDGSPGGGATVRIRGYGSLKSGNGPLFVVDGIPVSGNIDEVVNPNDIKSVDVLKDASAAAIYGSRGANGVIQITTNRGLAGKTKVTFSSLFGMRNASADPEMLDATEWAQLRIDAYKDGGGNPGSAFTNNPASTWGKGTNWWDVLTRTGMVQNYNLNINGGSDNFTYNTSLDFFDDKGWIEETDYSRFSYRINTDYKLSDKVKVGSSLSITYDQRSVIPMNATESGGFISCAYLADPITPIYKTNEEITADVEAGLTSFGNPWSVYKESMFTSATSNLAGRLSRQKLNDNKSLRLFGVLFAEFELMKGLKFRTDLGVNLFRDENNKFSPTYWIGPNDNNQQNCIVYETSRKNDWVWNNILTYSKEIGEHNFSLLAGVVSEKQDFSDLGGQKSAVPSNDEPLRYLSAATEGDFTYGSAMKSAMISYLGRGNYSYADKYLLTASVRRDGSSQFAKGNKWGTFPSFSIGWRISEESFFQDLNIPAISSLKLRGGWGQLGNQAIPSNSYITLLRGNDRDQYPFGENENLTQGYRPDNAGNEEIKWETHEQTNLGFDLVMFDSKLVFSSEYYVKNVKDMILDLPVPIYSGQPSPLWNAGSMQNRGLELNLEYYNYDRAFKYSVGGNISFNHNEITSLAGGEPIMGGNYKGGQSTKTEVGHPVSEYFGWKVDGVFQNNSEVDAANALAVASGLGDYYQSNGTKPGDFKFQDIDGNGIINNEDKTFIGSPHPDFFYGFNANLKYKNFEFNMLFQGVYGNKVFLTDKYYSWILDGNFNVPKDVYQSAWKGEGTSNTMFRVTTDQSNGNSRTSDWYVEDGSYLRLKNLELAYNVPEALLSRVNLGAVRVFVSAENLFTISSFPGLDPETGENHGTLSLGVQQYIYPVSRTFMGGLKIKF